MRRAHPVEVIRAAERPLIEAAAAAGDPDAVMRRAAAGVAHHTAALLRERTGGVYGRSVLLLVGSGDNGGDALYAGAILRGRGCRVEAVLSSPDRAHERGLAALRRAGGRVRGVESVGSHVPVPDVAVDGVVGLNGRGPLRDPAARIVGSLAAAGVPWVAVDLPSGVDADTGTVHEPHVRATLTVTFGLLRRAHLLASPECGRVELVDIGLTEPSAGPDAVQCPDPAEVGRHWPVPGLDDDKYTQGVVAVRAGSERYPGAAVLCVSAAVAATSGMVRYVGSGADAVLAARPEVVCHPTVADAGRAQAWIVGPGGGTGPDAVADIDAVLAEGRPTVLDADALTCVATHPVLLRSATAPVLLTPHAGEFDRLTGGWDRGDRPGALRRYVAGLRDRGIEATVLLKGRVTLVDDGETTFAVDSGSSWAATAGSGDVLSGIVGALLASGRAVSGSPAWPAVEAATVHGEAARRAAHRHTVGAGGAHRGPGAPIGASDLLAAIPGTISALRGRESLPHGAFWQN
ncbi:bifunctional ADP-dependent NAD(P)H-hydrate dehydratase/NAD(P)H-hydrate epimerase [Dietzia lutea]|uniref:ADP-dependent (S)-NAD(P)H-hydrate dehydratase n=1 Tax=Dietzia lutea TaxID=546160 RepID=A0A2S1R5G4_9ACTN|nr:bifunctional ADP-dependent NAD(P)H-hydrate dehydratase/NAD(P)H-hydrate epimerase [Dietzia lutea]AWH91528.1 bifunctional ADP-dependent (S)-NAD(P)H-hydrate dehydratase/NAD(P)H-hydrate epimerase [Dietzia lutea]